MLSALTGCSTTARGRSTTRRSGRSRSSATGSYVADEASDVDVGQSLSKETRPERLHVHSRRLDEGVNLVLRDGDFVVVENEGGVDARELGDGGHGGGAVPVAGGERP